MELRTFEMVNAEGKRNVKLCNQMRSQAYDKVMELLADAGLEPVKAANGDLSFPLAIDANSGDTYYIRLAVSLSNKPLEAKVEKKAKAKVEDVEVPQLFD